MKLAVYKEKSKNFSDIEFLINNCQISEYEKIYIDSFDNGEALISNIKSGEYYDIVFLYCTYGYDNGYIIGNKKHCFKVKNNCDIKFIPYSDILYFMSTSRKISVVTKNSNYECYGKINELNNVIGFIKVHKSFLINLNYVKEYNYKSIKMLNNEYIPISQSLRTKVKTIMENLE
ncbi:MAG: LytTR family DNA-binding domain-containing protein [Clostridia bacterium]|nr:LytTR family DNA-binding domain-containing protein [Clostridia bacterium]